MIEKSYFYSNAILLAIGTIIIRGSFIAFSKKILISSKFKEVLSYIPAAIFPALFIPACFYHEGIITQIGGKERLLVLILSMVMSFFIKNTLFIICFGLSILYLLTQVFTFFSS
jgi:branched-subunit amino acid transport protein